jgi:uncharacterized membrane protein
MARQRERPAGLVRPHGVQQAVVPASGHTPTNRRALILPGILLGIGLGGFVDGIVLHQMLQWHHMLTSHGSYPAMTVAGLEVNTLWDGIFHAGTWIATAIGLFLLWKAGRRGDVPWSGQSLLGLLVMGWGLFNLVEGLVDHHILTIHHVRYSGSAALPWDLGFLAFGAVLVGLGWWLYRTAAAPAPGHGEPRV